MPRRLGQHFLRPPAVAELVQLVAPQKDDVFLEIGPGTGALTWPLAARAARVVAVEIDRALVERLRAEAVPNLEVVEGDALAVDLKALAPKGSRLAGNLPYYMSSPLLRRFLDLRTHVRDAHLMLQEEVARRVASPPGSREYGILSVLYAAFAEADVPLTFGPRDFDPPPKVSSAILRVRFLATPRVDLGDIVAFERFLHAAFAQRRRTILNNLRTLSPDAASLLTEAGVDPARRAETLRVEELVQLARRFPLP